MALTLKKQEIQDRRRQTLAMLITFLIGIGTILMLYLMKVNFFDYPPPNFEYGMQVSYGTDEVGSGDDAVPIEDFINNDNTENTQNQNQDRSTDNVETTEESPLSETRVNTKPNKTNTNNPKPNTQENQSPPKKVTTRTEQTNKDGQGDDKDKTGNKGKETGINQQGLYTGSGGSGGASLSLSGWKWEAEPKVEDNSNSEGIIIFDVSVDEEGYFTSVKPRYPGTTVTDKAIVEKYRRAVLQAYLIPDGSSRTANISRGMVTYTLKSR